MKGTNCSFKKDLYSFQVSHFIDISLCTANVSYDMIDWVENINKLGVLQTPDQMQQMDADSHGQKVLKSFHCQTCSIESIGF